MSSSLTQRKKLLNPTAQKLWQLITTKQTNLAVAADVTESKSLIDLLNGIGPEICVLKTHIDIIEDFSPKLVEKLQELAEKYQFIIFEDRKFADIGNTAKLQYEKGIYRIADWASIVDAHILPGSGIIQGLKEVGLSKGNGLLLLAELSSKGNLITEEYIKAAVKMAQANKDFVIGFICQHRLTDDPDFIHMTPGVHISDDGDNLAQGYITPEEAIIHRGTDVIIVGRGIYSAANPKKAAQDYRKRGWKAYEKQCNKIGNRHGSIH
jgi:uridine monophosphate synthetase